jgi:hypothetical protein
MRRNYEWPMENKEIVVYHTCQVASCLECRCNIQSADVPRERQVASSTHSTVTKFKQYLYPCFKPTCARRMGVVELALPGHDNED